MPKKIIPHTKFASSSKTTKHLLIMRTSTLLMLVVAMMMINLAAGWDCDKRCDGYKQCVKEEKKRNGRRELMEPEEDLMDEEEYDDMEEEEDLMEDQNDAVQPFSNLRASGHRQLRGKHFQVRRRAPSLLCNTLYANICSFLGRSHQIKMCWKEHYCVSSLSV